MPEIVDVSIPSSRTGPASKFSFQACFESRARTFNSIPLSVRVPVEDLFSDPVRRALRQQALRQAGVVVQRLPRPAASQLRGDLRRLVPEPLLDQLVRPPAGLEVMAVRDDRLPQLLHALLARRHGGDDGLPAP